MKRFARHRLVLLIKAIILTASTVGRPDLAKASPRRASAAIPDGSVVFTHTTGAPGDPLVLSQLSCLRGECTLASAILTPCEVKGATRRRSLGIDSRTTRDGGLSVAARRNGNDITLSVDEHIPFASVQYRLVVKSSTGDLGGDLSLVEFSGVSVEHTSSSAQPVRRTLQHLTASQRRNLEPCGLHILENALEFTQD